MLLLFFFPRILFHDDVIFSFYLVACASAFNDEGDADYLHASVSGTEQRFIKLAHASIYFSLLMLLLILSCCCWTSFKLFGRYSMCLGKIIFQQISEVKKAVSDLIRHMWQTCLKSGFYRKKWFLEKLEDWILFKKYVWLFCNQSHYSHISPIGPYRTNYQTNIINLNK